jgi:hypothetical protein
LTIDNFVAKYYIVMMYDIHVTMVTCDCMHNVSTYEVNYVGTMFSSYAVVLLYEMVGGGCMMRALRTYFWINFVISLECLMELFPDISTNKEVCSI